MIDLYITKDRCNNYIIKDSENNHKMTYIFYTKKQAIKKHRENFNLRYKHLNIIEY